MEMSTGSTEGAIIGIANVDAAVARAERLVLDIRCHPAYPPCSAITARKAAP